MLASAKRSFSAARMQMQLWSTASQSGVIPLKVPMLLSAPLSNRVDIARCMPHGGSHVNSPTSTTTVVYRVDISPGHQQSPDHAPPHP